MLNSILSFLFTVVIVGMYVLWMITIIIWTIEFFRHENKVARMEREARELFGDDD